MPCGLSMELPGRASPARWGGVPEPHRGAIRLHPLWRLCGPLRPPFTESIWSLADASDGWVVVAVPPLLPGRQPGPHTPPIQTRGGGSVAPRSGAQFPRPEPQLHHSRLCSPQARCWPLEASISWGSGDDTLDFKLLQGFQERRPVRTLAPRPARRAGVTVTEPEQEGKGMPGVGVGPGAGAAPASPRSKLLLIARDGEQHPPA